MFPDEFIFRRRFSQNLYRSLSLPLAEMSFLKDWVNDTRGDPYPLLSEERDVSEEVGKGLYTLSSENGGEVCRLLGSFFPYATYELTWEEIENASAGFSFTNDSGFSLTVRTDGQTVRLISGETDLTFPAPEGDSLSLSFRHGGVSLYTRFRNAPERLISDVPLPALETLLTASAFRKTRVGVLLSAKSGGKVSLSGVRSYLTCGISQADIKPVKYENGEILIENGRVFLTASARQEKGSCQIVLSWCPTTSDFRMEGALFFDCGDRKWSNDVAVSLIFDRTEKRWIYWMCAFSHGHILGRGTVQGDPRFGINLLSVNLMEPAKPDEEKTAFRGFTGDEDPDLILRNGKWYLTVCRVEDKGGFHYYRFVSDQPLDGFSYEDRTPTGDKTGGMFSLLQGNLYFICGSDFHKRAVYDVYAWNDFSSCSHLCADFDDGGFRGWGSVMELPCGSEKRTVWITFDRHNASAYNWSYGNLYVFDMEENLP